MGRAAVNIGGMSALRFDEGNSYLVQRLHSLDLNGKAVLVQDVAVVFTPGWIFVQEASREGYVLPRERVLLVEGVRSAGVQRTSTPAARRP